MKIIMQSDERIIMGRIVIGELVVFVNSFVCIVSVRAQGNKKMATVSVQRGELEVHLELSVDSHDGHSRGSSMRSSTGLGVVGTLSVAVALPRDFPGAFNRVGSSPSQTIRFITSPAFRRICTASSCRTPTRVCPFTYKEGRSLSF